MALAIRGVNNYIKKFSLSNYSLTVQIIIINLLTATFAFIFLFLFNYFLLSNNKNLEKQIDDIKYDLNHITNYLADKSVIRIAQFYVETCSSLKDHQVVISKKCLEYFRKFSEASELQLDPTFTQEYILENYLNNTNSVKVYDDTKNFEGQWIKFADTEDTYVSDDIVELDIGKNIIDYSNNLSLYIKYKDNYLQYFNYIWEYFNRSKIKHMISQYKGDNLLVGDTLNKQSNLSYIYENENTDIVMVYSSPILKNNKIHGVVLVSSILNKENDQAGLISFFLINIFIIIICIMFLFSMLFSQSIVAPIKILSKIVRTERDKSNKNNKFAYPNRKDEIGILSVDIRSMSEDLKKRINEIESFAADVSHELKNPLASLKSSNELLVTNKISDDKKYLLLKNMQKDIERMNALITDISSYTLTQVEIDDELFYSFDLVEFLKEFLQSYSSNSKDIKINFEFENQPSKIYANKDKLAQVFINLIENSLSYSSRKSEILIYQKIEKNKVVINLSDQGKGISEDLSNKIFERFYKDRPFAQDQHSGLGLSIAKKIIESFSGSIKLINTKSQKYLGACFEIILPLKD